MLSTCKWYSAIYLYDAVYLYLQTLNQSLAEGYSNYRDGRLIFNKTIGQRFVGQCSIIIDSPKYNVIWLLHGRTILTAHFDPFV